MPPKAKRPAMRLAITRTAIASATARQKATTSTATNTMTTRVLESNAVVMTSVLPDHSP